MVIRSCVFMLMIQNKKKIKKIQPRKGKKSISANEQNNESDVTKASEGAKKKESYRIVKITFMVCARAKKSLMDHVTVAP